jgi:hypothetical protein
VSKREYDAMVRRIRIAESAAFEELTASIELTVGAKLIRQLCELSDATYRYTGDRLISVTLGHGAFMCLKSELAPETELSNGERLTIGAAYGHVVVHRSGDLELSL